MSPRLKISNLVIQRLKKVEDGSTGQLFGINDDKSVFIIGFSVSPNKKDNSEEKENIEELEELNNYDILPNLPGGLNVSGNFQVSSGEINLNFSNELLEKVKNPVVIHVDSSSKDVTSYLYQDGQMKKEQHTVVEENELSKLFLHLRLVATIPISCDFQYESVQETLSTIQQKITARNGAFQFEGSNIYILSDSPNGISGISSGSTLEEVFSVVKETKSENRIAVANVSLFLKTTNNEQSTQLAPLIKHVKKEFKHASIDLLLDGLVMAPKSLKIKELYPLLRESASRSLILNEKCLLSQLKSDGTENVSLPHTYHFLPQSCGHFISITYPSKKSLDQLKKCREIYHILMSLPLDTPVFRPGSAFDFSCKSTTNDKILLNPHEGLGPSGVVGGEPCFVQGRYAYHHYMQDNFDDSGWGCAYRSLQTVFSWFRLQGYTNLPIPTHEEIQKCLVAIGDKLPSFVGSNQWIGSTEVSFVLDTMLGVSCRIVNVSSGEEMSMKGGELSYHFKTQGTPVMIGGGVLAHTIIGVDYNKKTGDIKFLILDPHYTGGEDLNVIQSKGWCGWKKLDFWKKNAFYNMCMPLRPKCV